MTAHSKITKRLRLDAGHRLQALLADSDTVTVVNGDLRDPAACYQASR